jgi:P27 family predicted phage terminase small subunit
MGRRGPQPAPTAIKLAKGERRPSRVNYEEPEFAPATMLDPPKDLKGVALAEWKKLCPLLTDSGVLKETDLGVLGDLCRTVGDQRLYESRARRAGANATTIGFSKMVKELRTLANVLRRELGLTPSSRSGVKAPQGAGTISKNPNVERYLRALPGGRR